MARVARAWLLRQEVVTSVIVGARRLDQLEENLLAPELQFSKEELARLDAVSVLPIEYPGWMLKRKWDERVQAQEKDSPPATG